MNTNIDKLPEGKMYFTEIGWSDRDVWVVIKETPKTRTLAKVEVAKSDQWKPEWVVGGFSGICTNQEEQQWVFDHVDLNNTTQIFKTKKGWSRKGRVFKEDRAYHYYDYNF